MSNKLFLIVIILIAVIGVASTITLYSYTAKLQKESSIITFVSTERWPDAN